MPRKTKTTITTPKPKKPRSSTTNSFSKTKTKKSERGIAISYNLIIPAGPCPIDLKGTSKKIVKKWCDEMVAYFDTQKQYLGVSTQAYKYYVRYYYNSNTQEYKEICSYIDEFIPDIKLEEQTTTTEETVNE
jgi:hypothetical protein